VSIPAGALPAGTTVSVYPVIQSAALTALVPVGESYVASIAVSWKAPDGTSPTATAPVTMTITDPNIKAGDTIYEITSAGLKAVGTASADGAATITFTNDPTFVVTSASATTTTTTPAPPAVRPLRAVRTYGFGLVGRITTMRIVGVGFYGQPRVTSTEQGTRVGVIHDYGRQLVLRVLTKGGSTKGVHTFTIRLADGSTCKINYLVK
jgi:hypothetical protein